MIEGRKPWMLFWAGITVVALLILAIGITGLEFEAGRFINPFRHLTRDIGGGDGSTLRFPWLGRVLQSLFILSLIALVINLFHPRGRRQLLKGLVWALIMVLSLWFFINVIDRLELGGGERSASPPRGVGGEDGDGISVGPVRAPDWSAAVLIAIVLAIVALIGWRLRQAGLRSNGTGLSPLLELADHAGEAAEALRGGERLRDVVLRCYHDMTQLLVRYLPDRDDQTMTAREFEQALRRVGIRDEHVGRLTRLFERVRYGDQTPDDYERRDAITSLEAIERAYRS